MNYRNRNLLDLARGQRCQNCGGQDGTVVSAHSNQLIHGKGRGIKAHDCYIAWLCYKCHVWLDQGVGPDPTGLYQSNRDDRMAMFSRAMARTWLEMWQQQLIQVTR